MEEFNFGTLEENKDEFLTRFESYKGQIVSDVHAMIAKHNSERIHGYERMPVGYEYQNGDCKYKVVFSSGKQQPVFIIEIDIDGICEEVVYRPSHKGFDKIYNKYESVRNNFPKLFAVDTPSDTSSEVQYYFVEAIRGYEEKRNLAEFKFRIVDAEFFDTLVREFFQISDEILDDELVLQDISPTMGHNFIYNKEEERFMFFDIDTLSQSNASHPERYIEFLENVMGKYFGSKEGEESEINIKFVMTYFQYLFKKYGAGYFNIESPVEEFRDAVFDDEPIDPNLEYRTLTIIDEAYQSIYDAMKYNIMRKYESASAYPALVIRSGLRKKVGQFNPNFLKAIIENNVDLLKSQFIGKKFDDVYQTTFLTVPQAVVEGT